MSINRQDILLQQTFLYLFFKQKSPRDFPEGSIKNFGVKITMNLQFP